MTVACRSIILVYTTTTFFVLRIFLFLPWANRMTEGQSTPYVKYQFEDSWGWGRGGGLGGSFGMPKSPH
jgi:hypothetical protein